MYLDFVKSETKYKIFKCKSDLVQQTTVLCAGVALRQVLRGVLDASI